MRRAGAHVAVGRRGVFRRLRAGVQGVGGVLRQCLRPTTESACASGPPWGTMRVERNGMARIVVLITVDTRATASHRTTLRHKLYVLSRGHARARMGRLFSI